MNIWVHLTWNCTYLNALIKVNDTNLIYFLIRILSNTSWPDKICKVCFVNRKGMHSVLNGLFSDKNMIFYMKSTQKWGFTTENAPKIRFLRQNSQNGYLKKSGYFVEIHILKSGYFLKTDFDKNGYFWFPTIQKNQFRLKKHVKISDFASKMTIFSEITFESLNLSLETWCCSILFFLIFQLGDQSVNIFLHFASNLFGINTMIVNKSNVIGHLFL